MDEQTTSTKSEPQPTSGARLPSVFWAAVLFALVAIGCKAAYLGWPEEWTDASLRQWRQELAIYTRADLVFAIWAAGISQGILLVLSRWPRGLRFAKWGLAGFAVGCVALAVVHVPVFKFLRSPACWSLVEMAGGFTGMTRVAWQQCSALLAVVVLGAVAAYLGLLWLAHRFVTPGFTWHFVLGQALCVAGVVWHVRQTEIPEKFNERHDRRIAWSPHQALLSSAWTELRGRGSARGSAAIRSSDLDDFRTAGEVGGEPTPGLGRGPRNVIFVVMESVGTRYLSLYGGQWPTTPVLESEARSARVYDNIYSLVTNSGNSLHTMVLGRYPPMSYRELYLDHPETPAVSLGQILQQRGYSTAFISACDWDYSNGLPFLRTHGFQTVKDYRDLGEKTSEWGTDDALMFDEMMRWIGRNERRPFFLTCWTHGTHHPYERAPGQAEIDFFHGEKPHDDWDLGHYLNALHYIDAQLGRLFGFLREQGLADDTLVVIVGDHGEAFGVPHPNYGHAGTIFQEDVNVPLILWNPVLFPGGSKDARIGGLLDVPRTILDLLNLSAPESWQGHSLFSPKHPNRAYFYGQRDNYLIGVREGRWKYILNTTESRDELYDLAADPEELSNVARVHPEVCRDLRRRGSAWLQYEWGGVR